MTGWQLSFLGVTWLLAFSLRTYLQAKRREALGLGEVGSFITEGLANESTAKVETEEKTDPSECDIV